MQRRILGGGNSVKADLRELYGFDSASGHLTATRVHFAEAVGLVGESQRTTKGSASREALADKNTFGLIWKPTKDSGPFPSAGAASKAI